MSVVLIYAKPGNDLSQLHDELLRAAALLTPPADADNTPEIVQGDGDDITLTMPDAVDTAAIDALIAAHIPMARYDPATQLAAIALVRGRARRRADLENLQHSILGAATFADGVVVFNELLDVLRKRDREAGVV